MTKNTGGPAFPRLQGLTTHDNNSTINTKRYGAETTPGMTLRQWYAGLVLQGMLASGVRELASIPVDWLTRSIVGTALELADALIAEEAK